MSLDFIGTIDSDDEGSVINEPRAESSKRGAASAGPAADELDPEFAFDLGEAGPGTLDLWGGDEVKGDKDGPVTVDDIIARRTGKPLRAYRERKRRREEEQEEESDESGSEESDDEEEGVEGEEEEEDDEDMPDFSAEGMVIDEDAEEEEDDEDEDEGDDAEDAADSDEDGEEDGASDSDSDSDEETAAEKARKDAFFSADPNAEKSDHPTSFSAMNLSRPLLRALASLGLNQPTPIQSRAVPLALLGRDILGSAVTGSGKTAAFMIPILERLSYRDRGRGGQASRVLVLCPTRELAVQCEQVGKALVERGGLDVRLALLVGGLSLSVQAHALRTFPDIIIATPGRLIDHLTNTPSFTLSALDILVIDEADRMLEAGFTDELEEIIRQCPRGRQTMLFSATMSDSVDELVKLSLDRPVRVFVDPKRNTAAGLTQEFVRIRADEQRSPSLIALCRRSVRERCIIFFRSKALAHQMRVVFGLVGLKAAELHGNLTQEQRLTALKEFKEGKVDYLLATDLASRGLDIKGVETVINYDMPSQLAQYTHRVGRTARAGRKGRSITLVGEADRKMLKAVVKQSQADEIRHRIIPTGAVSEMSERLEGMKDDIAEILKEEKEEKLLRQADMELRKGQNMVEHEEEIFSRPARTWFQSEKEKTAAKDAGKAAHTGATKAAEKEAKKKEKHGKYDGMSRKQKRRKMANEEEEAENGTVSKALSAAIRSAKRSSKPVPITENIKRSGPAKKAKSKKKAPIRLGGKKSAFDDHEGMRAKPTKVNLDKKGGKSKGKGAPRAKGKR